MRPMPGAPKTLGSRRGGGGSEVGGRVETGGLELVAHGECRAEGDSGSI